MDGADQNETTPVSQDGSGTAGAPRQKSFPPLRQAAVHLLPAALALSILLRWRGQQESVTLLLWGLLAVFGFYAALGDIKRRIIPNALIKIMACAWILVIVPRLFLRTEDTLYVILDALAAFLLCGFMMTAVYLISRKGIGGGDVKFITVSSLYLGTGRSFSALVYGAVLAAAACVVLLAFKKTRMKDTIPLVPFLYAGILIAVLSG